MLNGSVNKSLLKFLMTLVLFDFLCNLYKSDRNLGVAIPPLIISTIIAVIIMYIIEKDTLRSINRSIFIIFFGGLTLYFNNQYLFI